jgi:hypothetical protein
MLASPTAASDTGQYPTELSEDTGRSDAAPRRSLSPDDVQQLREFVNLVLRIKRPTGVTLDPLSPPRWLKCLLRIETHGAKLEIANGAPQILRSLS